MNTIVDKFVDVQPGDIVIVNNWDGNIFSRLIRFFAHSWSHTAIGFFPLVGDVSRRSTVFESNLTTGITDWQRMFYGPEYDLRVYRWRDRTEVDNMCWALYEKYNGNTYGFAQLLWFVWRWLVESLRLPARWAHKNFFLNKEICTEVVYVGLRLMHNPVVDALLDLEGRDQNTVHPGDIDAVCRALVERATLDIVYERVR